MRSILLLVCVFLSTFSEAQDLTLSSLTIPDSLKANVDSVIRDDVTHVSIPDRRTIAIERKRTVTVFNKDGLGDVQAVAYYDPVTKVKDIDARIYNNLGVEIEHFKDKDFIDASAADGISIFNDGRIKYLNYTPNSYPFTIVFTLSKTSVNTANVPTWSPVSNYKSSTLKSSYDITYDPSLGLRYKSSNLTDAQSIEEREGYFSAVSGAVVGKEREAMAPSFIEVMPVVKFSLSKFHLEGEDGDASDWDSLGSWIYDELLYDSITLSPEVVATVQELTAGITDTREKAKIIYEYMQGRTRYVSVQMGIGGWKPMQAGQVHELGYGDCKGLSNYTRALLNEVDVPSNYVVLYGDESIRNFDADFPGIQGNHAILTVPYEDDYIWLECTSQDAPFGHIAGFTDDRDVLVVTEDGGKIVHTKKYDKDSNTRSTKANLSLSPEGVLTGNVSLTAKGVRYDAYKAIEESKSENSVDNLKYLWSHLNGLQLDDPSFITQKDNEAFTVDTDITVQDYIQKVNGEYIYPINILNRFTSVPKRYKNRKQSFSVQRGLTDIDEVSVALPTGWSVTALPEPQVIESIFGTYSASITVADNILHFKRNFIRNKGDYTPEQYKAYRKFLKSVARADNQKIIIKSES